MCQALGVTKGSFYWHFADLGALKAAMIERWRLAAARDLIVSATETELTPRDLIIGLFEEVRKRQAKGGELAETALSGNGPAPTRPSASWCATPTMSGLLF
jgi:AcrR family transcriptional regulator